MAEVKEIVLTINGNDITVSKEEAKELLRTLNDLFGAHHVYFPATRTTTDIPINDPWGNPNPQVTYGPVVTLKAEGEN